MVGLSATTFVPMDIEMRGLEDLVQKIIRGNVFVEIEQVFIVRHSLKFQNIAFGFRKQNFLMESHPLTILLYS